MNDYSTAYKLDREIPTEQDENTTKVQNNLT